jgi:hypothetical protein
MSGIAVQDLLELLDRHSEHGNPAGFRQLPAVVI